MNENLPAAKPEVAVFPQLKKQQKLKRILTLIFFLSFLTALVFGGYVGYLRYFSPKVKFLAQVDKTINLVQNPDPRLVEEYKLDMDQLAIDQKIIIYGGYPEELKDQGGFLPESLMGIKEAIEKGNHDLARQRIDKVYPRVKNVITSKIVGPVVDQQLIPQEVMNEIDPEYHFHQKDRIGTGVSITKKEAFLALVKLWYQLKN